ncbi:type 1 glutamine amidotransferase domain-containing protein [Lactobacillus farciminis KCTC 3681 = DSM] [Lactiplantibacillus mudanjiangensis]|uniref:type 1 glutamine amidotransferase domain-containing protein n=1 Tax=Lactiplantibacillus mudanjiangensis TaxID=1296538 RepID=UPI0010147197|nr:type 1 glutamine amidotransferase domain-containing protein [Lactiplantibacillus mudanjiangensis]VDG20014.1 type 1 glutamine amidotransferase domain-containing protein [Lactobacillus farciminis KCTC 3681 = DSM] [Lactiplantibacillus mudanjiangensis]VDG33408.1 type 1 glutamine amidotransferase domain-containing protein [Lactobacillus farciminis KCTC 3681 = DSM] [Lactiplantibacillus mudanjiangensis]
MTKVLVVVTNNHRFGDLKRATGLWLSESVHFHAVMAENKIDVDYVSPKGGYVPLDPGSLADMDDLTWKFYDNADFRNQYLAQSLAPKDVNPTVYDAIFFAGGHGVLWDFPNNPDLAKLADAIHQNGGVTAAVCHGVVGLLGLHGTDGQALIAGKQVAGFSNEEETINQLTDAVPFLTEDALIKAGGQYTSSPAYTEHVVVDGNLVTGQNPQSAKGVAEAVVKLLAK